MICTGDCGPGGHGGRPASTLARRRLNCFAGFEVTMPEQETYQGSPGWEGVREATRTWLSDLVLAEVQDHIAEVMFDTHDADPDCLLCQRGVELGVWAHYGYPSGPWAASCQWPACCGDPDEEDFCGGCSRSAFEARTGGEGD